jgi:hypothetical protein
MRIQRGHRMAAAIILAIVALSGCAQSTSGSSGSRHKVYESIEELVADSTAVVVATASEQAIEGDQLVTRVQVEQALEPSGIAETAPAGPTRVGTAQSLLVRQYDTGSGESRLESGRRYLLFLNPTMLEGPQSEHFFVVGAVAGVYRAEGDEFRRTSTEDPGLPESLTVSKLTGHGFRMGSAQGDVWSVTVRDPVDVADASECDGDPSVAFGVVTTDLPAGHLGLTLKTDATEADALRVADCLRAALKSGEITVHPPR